MYLAQVEDAQRIARDRVLIERGREIREKAGLTQEEMGHAVGVTGACISLWESGKRVPRGAGCERYATVLRGLLEVVA